MKKVLKLLGVIVSTTVVFTMLAPTKAKAEGNRYEFDVISDTHIGADSTWRSSEKLGYTLEAIKKNYPSSECIVVNGDLIDNTNGVTSTTNDILTVQNYKGFYDVVKLHKSNLPAVYLNAGNHEFMPKVGSGEKPIYSGSSYTSMLHGFVNFANVLNDDLRLDACLKEDREYDYAKVMGDRFIFLAPSESSKTGTDMVTFSSDQTDFLSDQITKSKNKGTPIFIFSHESLYNTTYGSNKSDWGYVDSSSSTRVKNAINKYNKAFVFTSHTHNAFSTSDISNSSTANKGNVYVNGNLRTFNTSSVSEGKGEHNPQGYHVTVYSDGVKISAVEYKSDNSIKEIFSHTYTF